VDVCRAVAAAVLGDADNINNVVALHKSTTSDGTRVSDHLVEILGGNTED